VHTGFLCGDLKARGHLEDVGEGEERKIIIWIFRKLDGKA
jgi:hypothetical protein